MCISGWNDVSGGHGQAANITPQTVAVYLIMLIWCKQMLPVGETASYTILKGIHSEYMIVSVFICIFIVTHGVNGR